VFIFQEEIELFPSPQHFINVR